LIGSQRKPGHEAPVTTSEGLTRKLAEINSDDADRGWREDVERASRTGRAVRIGRARTNQRLHTGERAVGLPSTSSTRRTPHRSLVKTVILVGNRCAERS
jgi:hypothetical protein